VNKKNLSRRDILKTSLIGSTALALGAVFASPRAPKRRRPSDHAAIDQAAIKEAKVILYSSMDLPVGESSQGVSSQNIPACRADRAFGSERLFQRSRRNLLTHHAVEVINSSDARISSAGRRTAGWPSSDEDIAHISCRISRPRWHVRNRRHLSVSISYIPAW